VGKVGDGQRRKRETQKKRANCDRPCMRKTEWQKLLV